MASAEANHPPFGWRVGTPWAPGMTGATGLPSCSPVSSGPQRPGPGQASLSPALCFIAGIDYKTTTILLDGRRVKLELW